jgi:diguanylate cyclase (GGDEF)-like protein
VILRGAAADDAAALAERLRAAVEAAGVADTAVTISVGVAAWTPPHGSPQGALDEADRRLYAAKRGGRNRVVAAASETLGASA